ncbi:MAG TPA: hypothetical protein VFZ21_15380 [Gemmatimonadaceae bacterium]|nr:hypothetical protein [Gemmatimonadaceae bacterium]
MLPALPRALDALTVLALSSMAGRDPAAQLELEPVVAAATVAPAPSHLEAVAFDAARRRLVLFGGSRRPGDSAWVDSNDTWEWDGARWQLMPHVHGEPGARRAHALAFDPHERRVVLVGGVRTRTDGKGDDAFDDTWTYDGRRWNRGPDIPVMSGHGLVYDAAARTMLLVGYAGREVHDARRLAIWRWTPNGWTFADSTGPTLVGLVRAAYDARRSVLVVPVLTGSTSRVWEWDGTRWRDLDAPGPSPRSRHALAYDARSERVVLVGGRDDASRNMLGDMWAWDGARWAQLPVASGAFEPRASAALVADADSGRLLLFGGVVPQRGLVADLWVGSRSGWTRAPNDRSPARGPHAVGYRVIDHWDSTRAIAPARDFEGRRNESARATPVQVSVWYPATAGGTPMRRAEYFAIGAKRETLAPITEADICAASQNDVGTARFGLGIELPPRIADSLAQLSVAAVRDARPADGRFPLIVGALGAPSDGIAEYLASHGYVVVSTPDLAATATAQVNRPRVAIETATRNMEVIHGLARRLPFVDDARLGLLGVNFGGLAALTHQMRNMSADAVVSLDGWELKAGTSSSLLSSPYYEPSRVRVPYLAFSQDNAPNPGLAFSDTVFGSLEYSTRYAYVVRDMEHMHLLQNLMPFPQLSAERRLGYDFVWRTVRAFFDANVKGDSAAARFMTRSAVENGYPAWLVELERKDRGFAPIPTAEEVERIAMRGDVAKLAAIYRRARAENPAVVVANVQTLNLFAFRFIRRGDTTGAFAFNELAHEMFPASTHAANNLGNTYRDAGRMDRAIELWRKALTLIDADSDLAPAEKAPSRTAIETKIRTSERR